MNEPYDFELFTLNISDCDCGTLIFLAFWCEFHHRNVSKYLSATSKSLMLSLNDPIGLLTWCHCDCDLFIATKGLHGV